MSDQLTQQARILRELKANPDGVPNHKFPKMSILCYTKRIEELRKDGHPIIAERQFVRGRATGTWMYRLAGLESKKTRFNIFKRKERIAL